MHPADELGDLMNGRLTNPCVERTNALLALIRRMPELAKGDRYAVHIRGATFANGQRGEVIEVLDRLGERGKPAGGSF